MIKEVFWIQPFITLFQVLIPTVFAYSQAVSFETISKGDISSYCYNDPDFKGSELVIKDQRT